MFLVQDLLCFDEFFVEFFQRQARRQDGVLDIKEPIIPRRQSSRSRMPGFRCPEKGVLTLTLTIFGDFHTPLAKRPQNDVRPNRGRR